MNDSVNLLINAGSTIVILACSTVRLMLLLDVIVKLIDKRGEEDDGR